MEAVFEKKEFFVETELEGFLMEATEGEVIKAIYIRDGESEFVTLVFRNGYSMRVNVSCDSLIAMTRDVLAAL